ncbi:MAG: rane protein [Pseudonocardiales bacterium]|nr:rane protein [Pseudonocardiales bacterium]
MPKNDAAKPTKPTRAEKKAARKVKGQARRDQWKAIRQAFTMTRKNDKRLLPYLIAAFIGPAVIVYLIAWLITGRLFLFIPVALLAGVVAALLVFSRRAQKAAYSQADGQPGAALYVLQNLRGNDWKTTEAVAGNSYMDAVHRLTGRPGVVLVAEGSPQRVKALLAQEKRRVSRLVGETPIYDVIVGSGEGQITLGKLNGHLLRLPRNLSKDEVGTLNRRLSALGAVRPPLPQGPMPAGAKMRNVQRAVRRRTS